MNGDSYLLKIFSRPALICGSDFNSILDITNALQLLTVCLTNLHFPINLLTKLML